MNDIDQLWIKWIYLPIKELFIVSKLYKQDLHRLYFNYVTVRRAPQQMGGWRYLFYKVVLSVLSLHK